MPVPASINDLSTTESSNSPATTESPGDGDNYIRAYGAFIASLRDMLNGTGSATKIKVLDGTATGQSANSGADSMVVDGTGGTGLSFLGSTTSTQQILFGDTVSNAAGGVSYLHTSDTLRLSAGAATRLDITSSAATFASGVAISADSFTGDVTVDTSGGNVFANTYTPTLTGVTNVSASTARVCQYMRVGNVVTVSGSFNLTPTTSSAVQIGISLPIASDFASSFQCGGTAMSNSTGGLFPGLIRADATNNRAEYYAASTQSSANEQHFTFTYLIV